MTNNLSIIKLIFAIIQCMKVTIIQFCALSGLKDISRVGPDMTNSLVSEMNKFEVVVFTLSEKQVKTEEIPEMNI